MDEQLSISLSSDINYVYGTVNGISATFSLTAPGIWSAVVNKAANGRYVISITAYNNAGTSVQYNTVIYKLDDIITPKIDWKAEDYYNADDLNRIEANTQYLADYLRSLYYSIPTQEIKVDRDIISIDFANSINRVESNIETLKNNFLSPPGYKGIKQWMLGMGFNYEDANRLEDNLRLLYEWAKKTKDNQIFSGTFSCGTDWEGGLY